MVRGWHLQLLSRKQNKCQPLSSRNSGARCAGRIFKGEVGGGACKRDKYVKERTSLALPRDARESRKSAAEDDEVGERKDKAPPID